MKKLFALTVLFSLAACQAAPSASTTSNSSGGESPTISTKSLDPNDDDFDPVAFKRRIYKNWEPPVVEESVIANYPLGSKENPVRTQGVNGERAYLQRLICPNGVPASYNRLGSGGFSPWQFLMDIYVVQCGKGLSFTVNMDLYHPGYVEDQPIPGMSINPP